MAENAKRGRRGTREERAAASQAKAQQILKQHDDHLEQMDAEYKLHFEIQEDSARERYLDNMFKDLDDVQVIDHWRTQTHPETGEPLSGDAVEALSLQWFLRFDCASPEPDKVGHTIDATTEAKEETTLPRKPFGDDVPILTPIALAAYLGVSVSTIHRHRKTGRIPAPVQTSERKPCWSIKQAQELKESGFNRHYD